MRIGVDIRELEVGKSTGIGTYIRNFLEYSEAEHPEHEFFLYGNQHTDCCAHGPNMHIRIEHESSTLWWDQVVLADLAARDNVDVFFSPYAKGPGRVGCPLVVTVHDLLLLLYPQFGSRHQRQKNLLVKPLVRWVARRADLILTVSEHASRSIRALLGVRDSKVEILPNAVGDRYAPVKDSTAVQEILDRTGIKRPYVLWIGKFQPHKNVQTLLRAFARLDADLRSNLRLVLGGRPDVWFEESCQLAHHLGIGHQTNFLGHVHDRDMPAIYGAAELFVFPSFCEGFGLPPLEAMACGTAVVVSDRTSLPEVVGGAGLLANPDEPESFAVAMTRVLRENEKRTSMERKGLERAAKFRVGNICRRQIQLLEKVAGGDVGA